MGILTILKNNYIRLAQKKGYVIFSIALCFIAIILAIFFTTKLKFKTDIVYVPYDGKPPVSSKFFNMHIEKEVPPKSDILLKKYDAIVIDKNNGNFDIQTIKNDEFKVGLLKTLRHPNVSGFKPGYVRDKGSDILGFLVMFVLINSLMFVGFLTEDKATKTLKRIDISPVSIANYIFSQGIFVFISIYVITFFAIIISGLVFGINMGFTYFQYSYLVAILSLLATAYSLFMASVVDNTDNVFVMSSCIAVLTTILSGSFYAFGGNNKIWNTFVQVFPQKDYLDILTGIEKHEEFISYVPQAVYLMIIIIAFFTIGTCVCKKRFRNGQY